MPSSVIFASLKFHLSLISLLFTIITLASTQSPSPSNCTSACKSLTYYTCQICYQTCTNTSTVGNQTSTSFNFTMQSCQQQYCSNYTTTITVDSNNVSHNQTKCTKYQKRLLLQSQCILNCCDNDLTFNKFTLQTFNKCVSKNQQLKSSVLAVAVIVGIVIGGVLLAALVVVLMRCMFQKCSHCNCKCRCWRKSYSTSSEKYSQSKIENNSQLELPEENFQKFDKQLIQ